ncbi:MAG: SIMPL domain-containing protein [Proteobacteria bacterium]|nr:SIMPL domain-containing protein [Candidatus Enterousia scatequi]
MQQSLSEKRFLGPIILALGLFFAGLLPGYFYYSSKFDNNTVTVKGLAEQDVVSDLAIWKIKFVATGNDLVATKSSIEQQTNAIVAFLKDNGFEDAEIESGQLETHDVMADAYRSEPVNTRFILTKTMFLRSTKVNDVASAFAKTGDLINQGVVFDNEYMFPVSYIFTGLNAIKPQMLELATKNAHEAALEFAKSSNSHVGKIHKANQGVFSILPRDETNMSDASQQINKKVRVVSTIEYYLD